MRQPLRFLSIVFPVLGIFAASSAQIAADNAANLPYADGLQAGDNGGYGFGPWIGNYLVGTGTSATNGGSPLIDTAGISWSGRGNSGNNLGSTSRYFSKPLTAGQTLSLDFDPTWLSGDSRMILHLLNGSGAVQSALSVIFGSISHPTLGTGSVVYSGLPQYSDGYRYQFTLQSGSSFTASVTSLGHPNDTFTWNGSAASSDIAGIRLIFGSDGNNPNDTHYFNNLEVVPEPATLAVLGLGVAALRRRRR